MGKKLKKALIDARITQKELAEKAGDSKTYISLIANGRRKPSQVLLKVLAMELGCRPEDLI